MWTIAAPAPAASSADVAICSGVTGIAGCFPTVSPAPVTAHVMMMSRLITIPFVPTVCPLCLAPSSDGLRQGAEEICTVAATSDIRGAVDAPIHAGDIDASQIRIPKRAAVRQIDRQGVRLEDRTRWCKYMDQWSRPAFPPASAGNDVALAVQTHSLDAPVLSAMVCAERMQNREAADRAI